MPEPGQTKIEGQTQPPPTESSAGTLPFIQLPELPPPPDSFPDDQAEQAFFDNQLNARMGVVLGDLQVRFGSESPLVKQAYAVLSQQWVDKEPGPGGYFENKTPSGQLTEGQPEQPFEQWGGNVNIGPKYLQLDLGKQGPQAKEGLHTIYIAGPLVADDPRPITMTIVESDTRIEFSQPARPPSSPTTQPSQPPAAPAVA